VVAGGLGFAVSCLVACGGGSGLLSSDQASTLNSRLDQVSSAVQAGDCGAVTNATEGLSSAVVDLPPSVNSTLRRNLDQGISTVGQLALKDCRTTPATTTSTTTTTRSTTTATTPRTTSTQTSSSTTSTTPPPTTTGPATTPTGSGTTSTGSGGAGLGGGGDGGAGGAGAGNGSGGNGQ
jgi:hypothetical protein